jgi:hypothetical protein
VFAYGAIRRPARSVKYRARSNPQTVQRCKASNLEQSKDGAEQPASNTEQSVSGAKLLSAEHGAIRGQHGRKVSSAEQSAIDVER